MIIIIEQSDDYLFKNMDAFNNSYDKWSITIDSIEAVYRVYSYYNKDIFYI